MSAPTKVTFTQWTQGAKPPEIEIGDDDSPPIVRIYSAEDKTIPPECTGIFHTGFRIQFDTKQVYLLMGGPVGQWGRSTVMNHTIDYSKSNENP